MMAGTMELIATVTISANQATVTFSSIANNYTDLRLLSSARTDRGNTGDSMWMYFNGDTAASGNYSNRILYGTGGSVVSITGTDAIFLTQGACGASDTANTFGSSEAYIFNYAGNTNKSVSHSGNSERDATTSYMSIDAGLWSSTAAITSITLKPGNGTNFVAGSTFYLYGIRSASATPGRFITATGGIETISGGYKYHTFTSSGTFFVSEPGYAEVLVVAGGGGAGVNRAGGGGAGGLVAASTILQPGPNSVVVGAGGATQTNSNGTQSSIGNVIAAGGGFGGYDDFPSGGNGGSGGGGMASGSGSGGSGTGISGQGNNGGAGVVSNSAGGGGGGGAGAAGFAGSGSAGGNGGIGSSAFSAWGAATGTGQLSSGLYYFAGGGGGGKNSSGTAGTGGLGGGGNGQVGSGTASTPGTAGTGGGGGGGGGTTGVVSGSATGTGGSGVVIIRYPVN